MSRLANKGDRDQSGNSSKSVKQKIQGLSMTEFFTPEQVRAHLTSLGRCLHQGETKAFIYETVGHFKREKCCQLCAAEKLTFKSPPLYCSRHGLRIEHNATYYSFEAGNVKDYRTFEAGNAKDYFCVPCYDKALGDTIMVEGVAVPKARLKKKKNNDQTEELWVQCDKCKAWQHQICALFDGCRSKDCNGRQAEYTCPFCYIKEIEKGERAPLPQSALLGAKDLPRTILSDHIEDRLFRSLKHERQERATVQGKCYDEVPGVEEIIVRVVSSADEKLKVNPRLHKLFRDDNYPTELLYKSKAILLFQKIDGVDVCLFGMDVQEFGSECQPPNQRRVNLSCFDSVKYFRPEIKAVTGEALRTFVYHEILIGYLEYCKKRGFTSCYIWACPPLKGEDYMFYCHPELQNAPKSDRLRDWLLAMLKKASEEHIVVEITNFYDHFFVSAGECKAKVTAARLPYFYGDYWPAAVEEIIKHLNQEEVGRKDLLLMHKLGDKVMPMKDDFIMVHLQPSCSHCCTLMVSGNCWSCKQCKNFQICDECYEAEQKLVEEERHPTGNKDMHTLFPTEITGVPNDTKDEDDIVPNEIFDNRQAFLSICQGHHHQYDTLRRAKHSSMMVLYHLHNPAFVMTCYKCHLDIGRGFRCEMPLFYACKSCCKDSGIDHPHELAERDTQLRVVQLHKMLDALVHTSECRSPQCEYPDCRRLKGIFRHGIQCKVGASGGCLPCRKLWSLLQHHALVCDKSECKSPCCRYLKQHLRRLQRHSEFFRRAAVMEMMKQQADDATSCTMYKEKEKNLKDEAIEVKEERKRKREQ